MPRHSSDMMAMLIGLVVLSLIFMSSKRI